MADVIPLFPNRSDERHPRLRINAALAELRRVVPGWIKEMETIADLTPEFDLRRDAEKEIGRLRLLLKAANREDSFLWLDDVVAAQDSISTKR
jgi:hypothetical protein